MSYSQAMKVLQSGGCVYRRKWGASRFLMVQNGCVVLVRQHRFKGLYIFTAEDLTARDWAQEHFVTVSPTS